MCYFLKQISGCRESFAKIAALNFSVETHSTILVFFLKLSINKIRGSIKRLFYISRSHRNATSSRCPKVSNDWYEQSFLPLLLMTHVHLFIYPKGVTLLRMDLNAGLSGVPSEYKSATYYTMSRVSRQWGLWQKN